MEDNIEETVVNRLENEDYYELINLLRECKIKEGYIMLAMFAIGTHTEYYKVLYNRVNNNKNNMNDETFKNIVLGIIKEIDASEEDITD